MTKATSPELDRIKAEIEAIDHDIVALPARRLELCHADSCARRLHERP